MSAVAKNSRPPVGRGQGVGGVQTRVPSHARAPRHILNRRRLLDAPLPLPLPHKEGGGGALAGGAA
jgi:hypothetical protein